MKQLSYLFIIILLAVSFWLGRQSIRPVVETVETVRTDTIYQDRPVPVAVTSRPITVNVPRLVFMRTDTDSATAAGTDSVETGIPVTVDSVAAEIQIETRTYRDSLLTAQVSGPAIGEYRPTLDWYEVYGHTQTITNTATKCSRFAVTAGAGVAWTPEGIRPTVGVQVGVVLWSW